MEAELAIRALNDLSYNFDIHGTHLIADGDSSLYARLRDELEWSIVKYECTNHLIKNYKSNLYYAKGTKELGNILTEAIINKMCAYTGNVINQFACKDDRDEVKMKKLIKHIPYHIFGFHQNCLEDLCNREKNNDNKDERLNEKLLRMISDCANNIIFKASRVYKDINSNLAESYHGLRVKLDHRKIRNYTPRKFRASVVLGNISF